MKFILKKQLVITGIRNILFTPKRVRGLTMGSQENDSNWRGVPINEMYGSHSPWGTPEFPLVSPSFNHAVLYHVPRSGCAVEDRPPKPQIGQDKWDQEHVRLPCSSHSLYPVPDSNGETHLKKRWEMIEGALSKPIRNSQELADAILSYNTNFRNIWKFGGLHKLFNEHLEEEETQYFFDVTLPEIAKLALALPKLIQAPIPLLKQHKNRSISLSQQQIASLLANAFFCTFPRRNSKKSTSEYSSYPFINFNTHRLYEYKDSDSNMEKLKSICHYFRRVTTKVPAGVIMVSRRSVPPRGCPRWALSDRPLGALPLHVDSANTIEDADGLIQVDFANKYLGGGVLGLGCVQEEIRFVICPELMITMLFTEVLRPNEALMIIGCERYSRYTGYGHTFQWAGDYIDATPRDSSGRRRVAVLAIDAQPFSNVLHEYRPEAITRELNKAWVGVSFGIESSPSQSWGAQYPGVATGNWGCGAFGGDPRLKSLLQAMACVQAARPMAYYTFGDHALRDYIINVHNMLARHNVTVGQLYKYLIKFSELIQNNVLLKLDNYLEQVIKGENTSADDVKRPEKLVTSEKLSKDEELKEIPATVISIEDEINNSPDLFSQEEMDVSVTETNGINIPTDTKNKDAKTQENQSKTNRSYFDTISKMECTGMSDPVPNTSLLNLSGSAALCNSNSSLDSDNKTDTATEKRRMSRKITDYFSKKTI